MNAKTKLPAPVLGNGTPFTMIGRPFETDFHGRKSINCWAVWFDQYQGVAQINVRQVYLNDTGNGRLHWAVGKQGGTLPRELQAQLYAALKPA